MSNVGNNDMKQKIVLEGEKEYKSALKDAQRELKTLRSELKAETAELGKNATEQEKNAVKVKNLKKQIEEQEKIVKTYTEALNEVKEKYSDNKDEIAKWEVKLNDARTTLANMRSGLEDVGNSFRNVSTNAEMGTVAVKSVADAFSSLGNIGDSVSGAVEGIFSSMIDTVKAAVSELWGMITETAAKSNNWTDLASYFGSTTTEIQKRQRGIQATQGDFNSFTNLVSQLTWGGKAEKLTEALGLSNVNYDDSIAYTKAVISALHEMQKTDPNKANEIMSDVFGRRSKDFIWFVSNWEDVMNNANALDEGGFLMDEEDVSTMNDVWLMLGKIEEKWEGLKDKFTAGFGTITLDIMTNVSGALDALAKYFDAETPEEREAALEELKKNITEAFTKIAEAIRAGVEVLNEVAKELQSSEDPIVRTIGNLLSGIVGIMEWLTEDNMNNAVKALEIMAVFWITGKGASMVAKIASLAMNIMTIQKYKGLTSLLSGTAGSAAGNGAEGTVNTATTAAAGGTTAKLLSGLDAAGAAVLTNPVTWILGSIYGGYKLDQWAYGRDWNKYNENMEQSGETLAKEGDARTAQLQALYAQLLPATAESAYGTGEYNPGADDTEGMKNFFREHADELLMLMPDSEVLKKAQAMELADLTDGLDADEIERIIAEEGIFGSDWTDLGRELFNKLDEWINNPETQTEIPADWWKNGGDENGVTSQDISSLTAIPGEMKKGLAELVGSFRINMDGQKVAEIIYEEVSRRIASDIE